MPTDFRTVVSAPPSGRSTALILDHHEYARAVLLRGRPIPWDDVTQYASFVGQAQGLLKPDVTLVDLGALYSAMLADSPELVAAMSARTRTGFALKTLLSDDGASARALELATVVAHTSRQPLVVQVPSPLRWLRETHELAGADNGTDIGPDHAENASIYVADWLRRFASLPVTLLLLDGRRTDVPDLVADDLDRYTPITNAADHYRWSTGLRTDDGVEVPGGDLKGVAVPRDYWLGQDVAVPAADFRIAELPGAADAETVLTGLARLD